MDTQAPRDYLKALREVERELGGAGRQPAMRNRQATFLAGYEATFSVTKAAKVAKVTRQLTHKWRTEDPVFAQVWQQGQEHVRDAVLGEVWTRAIEGRDHIVRDRYGHEVAVEKRPSDRMLLALARALDPVRFGGTVSTVTAADDGWRASLLRVADDPEALAALDLLADHMVGAPAASTGTTASRSASKVPPPAPPGPEPAPYWPLEQQEMVAKLRGQKPRRDYRDPDDPDQRTPRDVGRR